MAQQGQVYASSGARFAYNSQAEADSLFMTWLSKCMAAGDWQSALAFLSAWDSSTGYSLPDSNDNYRGFSSPAAMQYRQTVSDWIETQRNVIVPTIVATQLVTGGQAAVEARAAAGDPVSIAVLNAAQGGVSGGALSGSAAPGLGGNLPIGPSAGAGSSVARIDVPASGVEAELSMPKGFSFAPNIPRWLIVLGAIALGWTLLNARRVRA